MTLEKQEIDRLTAEVAAQSALLDQTLQALQGKASGGGGGAPMTISGVNLHDVAADTPDTYINGNQLTAYKGWTTTDFIPVEKGKLYIAYSTSDIAARYCRMYDENKTGIAAFSGTITSTDLQEPVFLNGHNGYFRFSGTDAQIAALEFYEVVNFNWEV